MAIQKQGVIEAISTKEVKTKFGPKNTFSIKVDGEWYSAGFKQPPGKGTTVSFEYDESQWGKQLVKNSLYSSGTDGSGSGGVQGTSSSNSNQAKVTSGKGVFPIPTYDGQRSIIRQNATTNANYLLRTLLSHSDGCLPSVDELKVLLIETARSIEAYTTGDTDKEEAKKIAASLVAKKAWDQQKAAGEMEAGITDDSEYFE